jgi:benzoate transport
MSNDPRQVIDQSPMTRQQISVITLCVLLVALDGFDVLSISFAAPGISKEWGIDRAALGIVLSMELIGMGIGAFILGDIADRIGRRPTILFSLAIVGIGMFLASRSETITFLSGVRLLTGLGIGGILASINAMAAEFSNARNRNLCVTLMATGYPLGVIVGGSIASVLLSNYDWRVIFLFGSIVTVIFLPLTLLLMPESISYLNHRRPANALESINRTLRRLGHATIDNLPAPPTKLPETGIKRLFKPDLFRITLLLCLAYFTHIMTFYYIVKWIPKLVVDMGFTPALSGSVLVWVNVGGVCGALLLGILSHRFSVKWLVITALIVSAVMVTIFGTGQSDITQLSIIGACTGFFTNAAIVGMYAIFAQSFPTEVRAGGTGFVLGVGRGGAVLGPVMAGFLFESGNGGLLLVSIIMACGSLIAAMAIFAIPLWRMGDRE